MTLKEFKQFEQPIVADIVNNSSGLPESIYGDSTGVKTPEMVMRGMNTSHNRLISEEYLLNFRRSDEDMAMLIGVNNYRSPVILGSLANMDLIDDQSITALPPYKNITVPIGSVIRSRRSKRDFSGQTLTLKDLSTILFYAQGITGRLPIRNMPETVTLGEKNTLELRTAPSGGGLYPVDLYFYTINLESLENGFYRYVPQHHAVSKIKGVPKDFNIRALSQFGDIDPLKGGILVFFAYRLYANSRKYGDSGLAFAFIEVGEIAQNIHLACTALGAGACDIGGYTKQAIEENLDLDGITSHIIHLIILGK